MIDDFDDDEDHEICISIPLRHVPYRGFSDYRGGGEWDGDIIHVDPEFGSVFRASRQYDRGSDTFLSHYLGRLEDDTPYLLPEPYASLSTDPCDTDCLSLVLHGAGFDGQGDLYLAHGVRGGGVDEYHTADVLRWTGDAFEKIATFEGNMMTNISGPFFDSENRPILLSLLWPGSGQAASGMEDAGWVNLWTGSEWVQLADASGTQVMVDQSRVYFDEERRLYVGEYLGDSSSLYEVRGQALNRVSLCEIHEEEDLETLGESGFSFGGAGGGGGARGVGGAD